jgi:hypothetical protein
MLVQGRRPFLEFARNSTVFILTGRGTGVAVKFIGGNMKRPLLIAILLLIALSAAPACTVKQRPESSANKVVMKPDTASSSFRPPIFSKTRPEMYVFS